MEKAKDGITKIWPISKIKNWKKNPRDIAKKDLERLKTQIRRFGQYKPLIVNTNPKVASVGAVAGGNMRLRAMMDLGVKEIWVIPKHFKTEKEMIEISISDNDRAGYYNEDGLVALVRGTDIDLSGFSVDLKEPPNLDDIVANYSNTDPEDDLAPELPRKPKTKLGDVYKLGSHRVLCGDATKEESYMKLLGGSLANLIFTDAPYNVDYKSPAGLTYKSAKFRGTEGKIFNDNLSPEKYLDFIKSSIGNLQKFSTVNASIYWWFASKNIRPNLEAFEAAGFYVSQWILWIKNSMILSRQDYHRCFEPCLFGWKKGENHFTNKNIANLKDVFKDFKDNDQALKEWLSQVFVEEFDVWFQHRDVTSKYLHPTQKPVALAERAIKKNSRKGDIVLDAFGGSGSTLIAAEKLQRVGCLMEIDPAYVDVIVKRWEGFTGKKAVRVRK